MNLVIQMKYRLSLVILVVLTGCGAITSGTPTAAGQAVAEVVHETPDDIDPVPFATLENEYMREAVAKAVAAYESNGESERVVVQIPNPDIAAARQASDRLPHSEADSFAGTAVVYQNLTVRVGVISWQ
jgi:hypothetical protein